MAFAPLDPVLHNQLRLAIVSLLVGVDSADFNFLLEKTGATRGNLSVQITKLKDAGYVTVKKTFKDNYPNTRCSLSPKGLKAFESYVQAIKDYLVPSEG
ncbi:MAG: winged helix-turn-helix domain-containing protein [Flavobacteriales bacterium]